uniref:Uncharacterized protein n=1 Tax=Rhizophagus irregularis (strain DAOM 181602 / DAOM 197198 / MUCL 43194) TaxID=747089 RepID=U9SL29_RHIID
MSLKKLVMKNVTLKYLYSHMKKLNDTLKYLYSYMKKLVMKNDTLRIFIFVYKKFIYYY